MDVKGGADIKPQMVEVINQEPLAAENEAFIKACRGEETPLVAFSCLERSQCAVSPSGRTIAFDFVPLNNGEF